MRSQPYLRLKEIISPAFPSKGHSTISYRNFKNFNRESFRNDIAQQDWTCNGSDDPNVLRADWKTKFMDVVNFKAPLRTRRARIKKTPWINSELKKGMRDRDAAKRKAMASNDPRDWAKYKKLRNTNRGYYMAARGYEFYLRVLKVSLTSERSERVRDNFNTRR